MAASVDLSASVVGRSTLEPDAAGILRAISRIGYRLPEAVADLIDNSVDAHADTVLIRFFRTDQNLTAIAIVDDGDGMDEPTLHEAMRFGSRLQHGASELGKYGMGLKSASLNHARSVTVLTRQNGEPSGRRWTTSSIREAWKLDRLDSDDAARLLDRDWTELSTAPSGTVVLWQELERFEAAPGHAPQRFGQFKRQLGSHLGLTFHRFLDAGRLRIIIDLQDLPTGTVGLPLTVQALDPFPDSSGHGGYPTTFHLPLGSYGDLELRAHIWPPRSADSGYKLNGRVAQHQGLYFFRNDRLIQAGGWNGWRDDAEPHASLARASIDLSESFDEAFALNVQKSGVDAPPEFLPAMAGARAGETTLADYVRTAIDVYRRAGVNVARRPTIEGGLTSGPRDRINDLLADPESPQLPVAISWGRLEDGRVFELGGSSAEIILNQAYRPVLLAGRRASSGDAPLVKTLMFLLLSEDLLRGRRSPKAERRIKLINDCLLIALEEESRR